MKTVDENKYMVEFSGIAKSFGKVKVLTNVSFGVKPGEIHTLIGENGAGKSTLIKILCGVHPRNAGTIKLEGEVIEPSNPHHGKELGISVVYQELSLVNDLSVAENIFLHKLGSGGSWMNWKEMVQEARKIIESLGFDINPKAKVADLSIIKKQIVEIAKALSEEVKVLVLDEPTTVLGPKSVEKLFRTLDRLKQKGIAIIYISHHMEEIFQISDSVTVLKDGEVTGTMLASETNTDEVVKLMIGRELKDFYPPRDVKIGDKPILEVEGLNSKCKKIKDVSFKLYPGEVLGISGLGGSGRTETARLIFGADKKESGIIRLNGKEIENKNPVKSIANSIGFVPEDRKETGVFLSLSVKDNISLTNFDLVSDKLDFIQDGKERKNACNLINKLSIKTPNENTKVMNLSGGNQQKVALAKWLSIDAQVIIIDEPTRGVDVGAKVEIYNLINELAAKGVGVLVISSDMPEIIGISDRILVVHNGSIEGELHKESFSEENILRLSIGESLNSQTAV
ncbi:MULTISPECIES: sugar ABC transporter ATP-binding protein [unclassified Saccharicrinis]|uniref:sugar ABC transporter ATP-binding protein n=1 Tax=unclassified Saccharicrinis TaxID=2646859 RepID=UPI003D346E0F